MPNIVLCCGILERGKSGVGDYTRILADHCKDQGYNVLLVALNDFYIDNDVETSEGELRLSSELSWSSRAEILQSELVKFKCDWLSLQFVPYSFNSKGLFFSFNRAMLNVFSYYKLHVLFHEIWIGDYPGASLKEKIIGCFQKKLIHDFLKASSPNIIHTTNFGYLKRLEKSGSIVEFLPMFGTVPVIESTKISEFEDLSDENDSVLKCCVFGSVYEDWPADLILDKLSSKLSLRKTVLRVYSIGSVGKGVGFWNRLKERFNDRVEFKDLGFLSGIQVSSVLQGMDVGLSSTPLDILGKSSSVATLLEHGLPVLIYDDEGTPNAELMVHSRLRHLVFDNIDSMLIHLDHQHQRVFYKDQASDITKDFLKSVESSF